jgi:glutamyl-Q tRNA(Asp) synthetase
MVTRFAPSPTGFLHMGHAFSARMGFDAAQKAGGTFLVRIEDIDTTRCRPEYTEAILEDLRFLGFSFPTPVRKQSEHLDDYDRALDRLSVLGVLYPCFCTRKEIATSQSAPQHDPQPPTDPNGPNHPNGDAPVVYSGRCRGLSADEVNTRLKRGDSYALRLHTEAAEGVLRDFGLAPLFFSDAYAGTVQVDPARLGDVVLARKEVRTSYHLAVVVDDAIQQVTCVTRGEDLLLSTHVHRVLQALLGFQMPVYAHHPLLQDAGGQRLAKRRGSLSIRALRQQGFSARDLWATLGLPPL